MKAGMLLLESGVGLRVEFLSGVLMSSVLWPIWAGDSPICPYKITFS